MNKEMQAALIADGEKLEALTGENHGPAFMADDEPPICTTCNDGARLIVSAQTVVNPAICAVKEPFSFPSVVLPRRKERDS